jgi:hypothetical protein
MLRAQVLVQLSSPLFQKLREFWPWQGLVGCLAPSCTKRRLAGINSSPARNVSSFLPHHPSVYLGIRSRSPAEHTTAQWSDDARVQPAACRHRSRSRRRRPISSRRLVATARSCSAPWLESAGLLHFPWYTPTDTAIFGTLAIMIRPSCWCCRGDGPRARDRTG